MTEKVSFSTVKTQMGPIKGFSKEDKYNAVYLSLVFVPQFLRRVNVRNLDEEAERLKMIKNSTFNVQPFNESALFRFLPKLSRTVFSCAKNRRSFGSPPPFTSLNPSPLPIMQKISSLAVIPLP